MKKVIKKNKNKPAQRKKHQNKRANRQKKIDKNLSLKEGLKKTTNDKVLLNNGEPVKNLKSLIRDIFNLKEARRQINFLGVDLKCISEHINEKFVNKCVEQLNEICKIMEDKKLGHRSKKDKYFQYSKQYNRLIPHHYSIINIDSFLINNETKIKKELRILELLLSYRELRNKDDVIRGDIYNEDNNSINLNDSVNLSVNNNEKSVEEENHVNISNSYYKKAFYETDYLFTLVDETNEEYKKIKQFLYRFSEEYKCPYPKLRLLQLYKLTKKEEEFKEYQLLYWYGCETPHLYSILRHGLRLPIEIKEKNIYNFGRGIMISHSPYTQLKYCLPRNNIAYLFVCGNDGLKSKIVHKHHPKYPYTLDKSFDSVCIEHKIKLTFDEENSEDYDHDYDTYCDYIVYDKKKINLLYLAKIEIP